VPQRVALHTEELDGWTR